MRLVDVLAAHFRVVSKGHVPPFPPEGKNMESEELAGKEQPEIDYMNALAAEVTRRGGKYYTFLHIDCEGGLLTRWCIRNLDALKSRRVSTFDPDKPNSLNMKYSCRLMIAID